MSAIGQVRSSVSQNAIFMPENQMDSFSSKMAAKRKWESFKKKMYNKMVHKGETVDDKEYLTVQRLTQA